MQIQEWPFATVSGSCASPVVNGVARCARRARHAIEMLAGVPPARLASMYRCKGSLDTRSRTSRAGWVDGYGGMGRQVWWPGTRMDPP